MATETATAPIETPSKPQDALLSLSESQRETWLKTGDLPSTPDPETSTPEPTAETAEALPAQTEAREDATSAQPPVEEPKTGKPRSDINARLGQLSEQKRQAIERAEAAERRAAELEAKLNGGPTATVPDAPSPAVKGDKEPDLSDFTDQPDPLGAWTKAMVKWELAQDRKWQAQQAEWDRVASRVEQIKAEGSKKYPDWDERMSAPDVATITLPPDTNRLVRDSEFSVDVLYHLSTHPAEARALAAMEPLAAAKEIGKLETRLSGSSASRPAASPPSHATPPPAPPTTLGKKPASPSDELADALERGDTGRYIELANQRELAERKGGRR